MKAELYEQNQVGDTWRVAFLGVQHLMTSDAGTPLAGWDGIQLMSGTDRAARMQDSFLISDTFTDRYWTFLSSVCELTPQERQKKWWRMRQLLEGGEIE